MRKLLVLSLCGLVFVACSSDNSKARGPEPAPIVEVEATNRAAAARLFTSIDSRITKLLVQDVWIGDGTELTLRALAEILGAQVPRPNEPTRTEEALAMIQAMRAASWYSDGVDSSEKIAIAEVFKAVVRLKADYGIRVSGQRRYTVIQGQDWPSMLASTLTHGLFGTYEASSGREIVFISTGASGSEDKAREALHVALEDMDQIESLAGEMISGSVLIAMDPALVDRHVCGLAIEELFVTLIRPDCLDRGVVIHELVHLSTPAVFSAWFEEGTAYWISAHIRGALSGPSWEEFRTTDVMFSTSTPEDGAQYSQHSDAGFILYGELAKILGSTAVGEHIRSVSSGSSGTQVLESIISHTPPEKQTVVRNLIYSRCKDKDRFGVDIPCRLPL